MQVGVAGKRYGLQRPVGLSLFKNDDEDEETDVNKIIQVANRKKALKQAQQDQAKVLSEDPTAYDYDSVYDAMQTSRKAVIPQKDTTKKPKYIHALLEKAEIRKREESIVYDRLLQKERETEGNTFAGKEKFLTAAYVQKLKDDKMWQEEDRKAAFEEDVTKKVDLGSFYVNLLTHNEAYGGGPRPSPSEPTQKSEDRKQPATDKDVTRDAKKDSAREEKGDKEQNSAKNEQESGHDRSGSRSTQRLESVGGIPQPTDTTDNKNKKRLPDESTPENQPKKLPKTTTTPAAGVAKRDDASVNAARERYLKRKGQL